MVCRTDRMTPPMLLLQPSADCEQDGWTVDSDRDSDSMSEVNGVVVPHAP